MSTNLQREATSAFDPKSFVVERGGDRRGGLLYVVGDEVSVKISSHDTNGRFAVVEDVTQPHQGPPLHVHHEQDEWWYILEGQFRFVVDGQEIHAGPGDTVFAARGTRHTFQNIGETSGRSVVTVVPGGLDLFFEELSIAAPPGVVPDPAKLAPIFQKHGLELLGPPLGTE